MTSELHIRHSLLLLFDMMMKKKVLPSTTNEEKKAIELINNTYGDGTVSEESTCYRWFAKFNKGDRALEDKARSGRPSEIDDEEMERLLDENDELTAEELAEMLGCSVRSVYSHLEERGWVRLGDRKMRTYIYG